MYYINMNIILVEEQLGNDETRQYDDYATFVRKMNGNGLFVVTITSWFFKELKPRVALWKKATIFLVVFFSHLPLILLAPNYLARGTTSSKLQKCPGSENYFQLMKEK